MVGDSVLVCGETHAEVKKLRAGIRASPQDQTMRVLALLPLPV
jgi:hypothetical protein